MNFISFAQIPDHYETEHFVRSIVAAGGRVTKIKRLSSTGSWPQTKVYYLENGEIEEITGSALMEKGVAYLVFMDSSMEGEITFDPLQIN